MSKTIQTTHIMLRLCMFLTLQLQVGKINEKRSYEFERAAGNVLWEVSVGWEGMKK